MDDRFFYPFFQTEFKISSQSCGISMVPGVHNHVYQKKDFFFDPGPADHYYPFGIGAQVVSFSRKSFAVFGSGLYFSYCGRMGGNKFKQVGADRKVGMAYIADISLSLSFFVSTKQAVE